MVEIKKYIKSNGCPVCGNLQFNIKNGDFLCSSCSTTDKEIELFGLYNIKYVSDIMKEVYEFNMNYEPDVYRLKGIITNIGKTYKSVLNT